jgi:hypothetical protein
MVKSKNQNRAMVARRARRGPRKNIQKQNQKASRTRSAPMRQGVALGKVTERLPTRMYQDGDAFVVEHDEYVADVYSDAANVFAYEVYDLNPGSAATFPWLSNIAQRYEEFEAVELTPHYETAAPTTASGKVILAIDFDPADPTDAGTKQELLNDDKTRSGPLWQSFSQPINRSKLQKRLFVNDDTVDAGTSGALALARQQDIGHLFVATTSTSLGASCMLGELWIRSRIRFYTPVLHVPTSFTSVTRTNQSLGSSATSDLLAAVGGGFIAAADVGDVQNVASGIAIGGAGTSQGPSPGGNWCLTSTEEPLSNSVFLIKFLRDWAGTITYEMRQPPGSGSTTAIPDFTTISPLTASQSGGPSFNFGPSFTDQILTSVTAFTNAGTALNPGNARIVMDVAAMAGTGLGLHSASPFTPNLAQIVDLFVRPSATSLAAFRAKMKGKEQPLSHPQQVRAVKKTISLRATSSTDTL